MGRKQKLRRDKQARRKLGNVTHVAAEAEAGEAAAAVDNAEKKDSAIIDDYRDREYREFPKSDSFLKGKQLLLQNKRRRCYRNGKIFRTFMRGATGTKNNNNGYGYGFCCVHSMYEIGKIYITQYPHDQYIHLAQPWFLDAAIRGSSRCAVQLMHIILKAKHITPNALIEYWMKMSDKYREWSSNSINSSSDSNSGGCDNTTISKEKSSTTRKTLKDIVERKCAVCRKKDSDKIALQQCMGCQTYCYCNQKCQIIHWKIQNHRCECKQLQILNKYHKPYAKEIMHMAAIMHGGKTTTHTHHNPALEKLRSKLGLSRPVEEYQELLPPRDNNTTTPTTHGDGLLRIIDPFEYLIAREDGTVWIGSIPTTRIGNKSSASDTTVTTTATATTSTTPSTSSNTSRTN